MGSSESSPSTRRPIPIACTLPADRAARQLEQWVRLRAHATSTRRVASGVRMTFPGHLSSTVQQLAAAEQACCPFLRLTTRTAEGDCMLDITADAPDAAPIVALLAGSEQE